MPGPDNKNSKNQENFPKFTEFANITKFKTEGMGWSSVAPKKISDFFSKLILACGYFNKMPWPVPGLHVEYA